MRNESKDWLLKCINDKLGLYVARDIWVDEYQFISIMKLSHDMQDDSLWLMNWQASVLKTLVKHQGFAYGLVSLTKLAARNQR